MVRLMRSQKLRVDNEKRLQAGLTKVLSGTQGYSDTCKEVLVGLRKVKKTWIGF